MSWEIRVDEVVAATQSVVTGDCNQVFLGVETDSRVGMANKIFVALKGDQFDGHNFIAQAVEQGATGVLVHRDFSPPLGDGSKLSIFRVKDTLVALQKLAHYWRMKHKPLVVAITGTNGKTSTKEFAAVLVSSQHRVHFSKGSFNNHWGVPLTLLGLEPQHEVCLVEMGMNHSGEIRALCQIATPNIGVVTTVGRGHLEGLGSLQAVAQAKAEIYEDVTGSIYNLDNSFTLEMYRKDSRPQKWCFSTSDQRADVHLQVTEASIKGLRIQGKIRGEPGAVLVPIIGTHHINNLMAAATIAVACNVAPSKIWQSLPQCRLTWGRNQLLSLNPPKEVAILFDGYNANPDSMKALVSELSHLKVTGKRGLILGEMLELGNDSELLHRELAQEVANSACDWVWFFGPHCEVFLEGLKSNHFHGKSWSSPDYSLAQAQEIFGHLGSGDLVAIKGSRGMKTERVLQAWGIKAPKA